MPSHKSAEKRVRQNKVRKTRNMAVRSEARTAVKKVRDAIETGNKEDAAKALKEATIILDRAATKNVHHPNNTGRRVSRLTNLVNKMS